MGAKVVVANVNKRYADLQVLDGISMSVDDGEFVAIVGPSGCGKSTLMRIIAGFEAASGGEVRINGAIRGGPGRDGISISQQGSVFPWMTVRQNVMFGIVDGGRDGKAALADDYTSMVGLTGFENSYPHQLSGGMLKRVEIARALVVKPAILYMDEPFSTLDALMGLTMRKELLRILAEQRHTVLLVTHDVEEALFMADRILVLSPRPTRLQATFDVAHPHPRSLALPCLQQMKQRILRELGVV